MPERRLEIKCIIVIVVIILNLERPPRRGDPILHAEIFPFCHRAHHSVGERQSESAWWHPTQECVSVECVFSHWVVSLAWSSLRTLLSTSRPCTTPSGRATHLLRRCYRSDSSSVPAGRSCWCLLAGITSSFCPRLENEGWRKSGGVLPGHQAAEQAPEPVGTVHRNRPPKVWKVF